MATLADQASLLKQVDALARELEQLKRDLLHSIVSPSPQAAASRPSLFGSVRSGDVTEEIIEEAKRGLFRDLRDLQDT